MHKIYLAIGLFSTALFAAHTPMSSCSEVNAASLSISAHAFNSANATTTRTPEGRPFKRKELQKNGDSFKLVGVGDFKSVYNPRHPDANKLGYVTYPNIDLNREKVGATSAATELRLLAKTNACGTTVREDKNSSYIRYQKDKDIFSDLFQFDEKGTLKLWTRRLVNGQEQNTTF